MKRKLFAFCILSMSVLSCESDNNDPDPVAIDSENVLLLKVDYLTNTFEGGMELGFEGAPDSFTIDVDYQAPGDFGGIQLYYDEIDEKIFDGTIHWMGLGAISFPESFNPPGAFERRLTEDYVTPQAGFENVFNPGNENYDYDPIWASVQSLVRVRSFLESNPEATVKLFLYTPSVGVGNPADWDWILIVKN